ncbi:CBS domain-containing protein [Oceanisphaera pacifica]|uniref:CBS domain-containing protein n=1 Tax=Oceanisphaera pacifica TaxID=2818389 RepID=A0ABS3NF66_9GAMM|nr:CBS domain-containing protein [Oceanisphaera pacifica]MBO1519217.1 CBS domain-containing protein [Oceanisphaera pacifica]
MATVSEIMRRSIPLLTAEMSITEALDKLLSSGLSGLPVVNTQRNIIGFFSEQDCIPTLVKASYHCDNRVTVNDIMYKEPLTVSPDSDVFELARLMGGAKPKLYPVIEDNKVVGMVTRHQVMQFLNEKLQTCTISY